MHEYKIVYKYGDGPHFWWRYTIIRDRWYVAGIAMTLRGARRVVRKDRRKQAKPREERVVETWGDE